jgi:hypothetical protein
MATFGQGINPQLGAIDYSPILRGSLAGAQMAAQGSQMIGQGLANLGEEAGKAVQKYYYNKDTKEMLGGVTKRIAGILDTDPYIANKLGLRRDPKTNTWDEKGIAVAVTNIGGGDVRKGVQMTNGFLSDRAAQQVQNSAFLGATRPGVIMPGQEAAMYSALGGENPMGFAQFLQNQELVGSQIKKNLRPEAVGQISDKATAFNARVSEYTRINGKAPDQQELNKITAEIYEPTPESPFSIQSGLRKEVQGHPAFRGYDIVNNFYNRGIALAKQDTGAADIGLIFSFMKVLDYNSTVREGEAATAQNAANVPDRIRNIYNQIIAGTRLQPAQRQEYVNAMKESAKTQFDQLKPIVSQYENIAKNNKVGFDDIMPTHYRSFEPSISATAAAFIPPATP